MSRADAHEDAILEMSRWQRAAIDKHTRWHLALLDAGIPEAEARDIIETVEHPKLELVAA